VSNGDREPTWFWKAVSGTLLAFTGTLMVKGCDEWQRTTTALQAVSAELQYQNKRVAENEVKLNEIGKNLQLLYERTVARFDERREAADRLVDAIDQRLDRLERYDARPNGPSGSEPRR
jgi:hypothetical protein